MKKTRCFLFFLLGLMILTVSVPSIFPAEEKNNWPKRVLITNDNGIEDIKIIELAKAFSKIAETTVVAPMEDRSGSSHFLTVSKKGKIQVSHRKINQNIDVYAVDGYPADCVVLALAGIMRDNPPDLVVSGINGGANLGKDWMFSGTIGAARIAAFAGFPAIAVSGLDSGIPGAVETASGWVVKLAQSRLVRELNPLEYITVSIPRIPPADIRGVRYAFRAEIQEIPLLEQITAPSKDNHFETWAITGSEKLSDTLPPDCDISLYQKGYIIVVPMIADEVAREKLHILKSKPQLLPDWDARNF
ncbi:MAG: 5'/3'-nucleotidase SurE [Candidatus Aminicenantes bacterium]|nr:5'/3'-nucleotidase SurE [Candidatus Aminicenantes bacterium]